MSREEIMRVIEDGDKYAGILLEDIEGKIDTVLQDHEGLDKKIDAVDLKLDDFRVETDRNFNLVFEEKRALRQESEAKFNEVFKKFEKVDERFDAMDEKFSKRFDRLEKIG